MEKKTLELVRKNMVVKEDTHRKIPMSLIIIADSQELGLRIKLILMGKSHDLHVITKF